MIFKGLGVQMTPDALLAKAMPQILCSLNMLTGNGKKQIGEFMDEKDMPQVCVNQENLI